MKPIRPRDMNELAVHIGKIATHEIQDAAPVSNAAARKRSHLSGRAVTRTIAAAVSVGLILACTAPQLARSADAAAKPSTRISTIFTDTALFRRTCIEADSGLTPAIGRCTPRDQRVRIR